jgi:hypothetical protein
MATLSAAELRKYEWRIPTFLERLASGTFLNTSNAEVRLVYAGEGLEERLRSDKVRSINKLKFLGDDGVEYSLQDLLKDKGFGGGKNPLNREEAAIALLGHRLAIAHHELGTSVAPVVVGGNAYLVSEVRSTGGTPKSDFHFLGPDGEPVLWVSHKHGRTAHCFQQWGGCSKRIEPAVHQHPETQEFALSISSRDFGAGTTVARGILDANLRHMSVYGNDFGKEYGQNNVQLVIQGEPTLSANTGNTHFDIGAFAVHTNGEEMPDDYRPTFMAIYRTDRNDFGIQNCRVGISPRKARLVKEWIDEQAGPPAAP